MTSTASVTGWRFSVRLKEEFRDGEAQGLLSDLADLDIAGVNKISIARVYYLQGDLSSDALSRIERLISDPVTELCAAEPLSGGEKPPAAITVEVAYRPGVRDPVEDSLKKGAADLGVTGIQAVRTAKEYIFSGTVSAQALERLTYKLLVNATVQQVVTPAVREKIFWVPPAVAATVETVPLLKADDAQLQQISTRCQLSLNLDEMKTIQAYFQKAACDPRLIELETIAQTWSEHCKHKTLRGNIVYTEVAGGKSSQRTINNLLKETIVRATEELNKPWCISVFEDNSGVVAFDEKYHACFKVETHNHPSALEPFGGASTGVGGVIRDILGTGLGAKPIASTDIFCFARPDYPKEQVPQGVLHPRRVIKGVVAGVKDYGNKMGIPTVNGAVLFDDRFIGNPLVYCGNVGLLPVDKVKKTVSPGMAVVVAGGRTGRDGVHGATFSSVTLHAESEVVSSTAVQIGDPITEKNLTDALLEARDAGLYSSVTDCGAGGLSSAVGEMGEICGARVDLEKVPLKYAGLNPTEIWISESQERVVFAVEAGKLAALLALFQRRGVMAAEIGRFTGTGNLELFYQGEKVGDLRMEFMHHGVPQLARPAAWTAPKPAEPKLQPRTDYTDILLKLLSRWDSCSKEWIVRQYDHEVQGGSVIKPIGLGPSDAAVIRPRLSSNKGLALANGINFRYGDLDPYWMAVLAVDEVARQVAAVGGSLDRLAILDNFCWGDPTRSEVLGSLVRASLGCYDAAKAYGTPFISGKDSLYNAYRVGDKAIQIPGTLLISGMALVEDCVKTISMDAKKAGNQLYLLGLTRKELGGSAYHAVLNAEGGQVPTVDLKQAPAALRAFSKAVTAGQVVSAHDCSEGGMAMAAAEMAFSGNLGIVIELSKVPADTKETDALLFSESATRLLAEVAPDQCAAFEKTMSGFPVAAIGEFQTTEDLVIHDAQGREVVRASVGQLRAAWQEPFKDW